MSDKNHESSQAEKFRDLARQLEADEDPAHFEETLRKVVTPPPPRAPTEVED